MIGRDGLHPPYAAFVSTGAARATQMLEILRHAAGQDDTPITAATGLRSSVEDRWRDAANAAGKGAELPPTVIAMLQARLSRLPPGVRQVLQAASLFGQTFWQGAGQTRPRI